MRFPRLATSIAASLALGAAVLGDAAAQGLPGPSSDEVESAVRLYTEGLEAFKRGEFAIARDKLRASSARVSSPNTTLIIAHAERELGRAAEAMNRYQEVVLEAERRVARGEAQYAAALEDARRWMSGLRPKLAEVTVLVPNGAEALVDGNPLELETEGARSRGRRWVNPGRVTVRIQLDGRAEEQLHDLPAGSSKLFKLLSNPPAARAASPPAEPAIDATAVHGSAGPPIASWVAAGVGLAGLGVFAGFGIASANAASELEACGGPCPRALEGTRDAGQRDQVIANVGLGVGLAGIAAAAVFWLVLPDEAPARVASRLGSDGELGPSAQLTW